MSPNRTRLALVTTLLALALPAGAQEKARPEAAREGIEAVEAQLARAVDRVSLPHAARLLGRAESARGYRLPGYGLVLVLTPRMLPGGEGQVFVLRGGAPKHRVHVESRRPSTGEAEWTVDDEQIQTFERQVLVLQHETEAARRAAEEDMERLVEDVRVRVALPPAPPPAPRSAGAPVSPLRPRCLPPRRPGNSGSRPGRRRRSAPPRRWSPTCAAR